MILFCVAIWILLFIVEYHDLHVFYYYEYYINDVFIIYILPSCDEPNVHYI